MVNNFSFGTIVLNKEASAVMVLAADVTEGEEPVDQASWSRERSLRVGASSPAPALAAAPRDIDLKTQRE